ncbi:hypothetical protein [Streptomyces luteireticuli]|uniref:Integral membrane protein n=1 Tax=Streptomyces luteireticuli TaxID=173858 RepID=A0ABN0YRA1_9ACTN
MSTSTTASSTPWDGVIFGSVTLLGAVVTTLCLIRARRTPTVANRSITAAFGICTLGVFFAVPAIAQAAADITGIDNIAKLIAHICAVLWSAGLQFTMVDIAYGPYGLRTRLYQRATFAGAILMAMIPLWLSANGPGVEFTTAHAHDVKVRIYLLLYLVYVFATCTELTFQCALASRDNWPERPWSSFGYGSSTIAAIFGMGYAASKASYLVAYTMGSPWELRVEERLSPLLSGISILFLFVGLTLPVFGWLLRKILKRPEPAPRA